MNHVAQKPSLIVTIGMCIIFAIITRAELPEAKPVGSNGRPFIMQRMEQPGSEVVEGALSITCSPDMELKYGELVTQNGANEDGTR